MAAFTGPKVLTGGGVALHFDLIVTPFKAANESQHWRLRHYQVGYPSPAFKSVAQVKAAGANVINIHQGVDTMINP